MKIWPLIGTPLYCHFRFHYTYSFQRPKWVCTCTLPICFSMYTWVIITIFAFLICSSPSRALNMCMYVSTYISFSTVLICHGPTGRSCNCRACGELMKVNWLLFLWKLLFRVQLSLSLVFLYQQSCYLLLLNSCQLPVIFLVNCKSTVCTALNAMERK